MKVALHKNRVSIFQSVNFQNNGNPLRLNSTLMSYTEKKYITNYTLVYIGHMKHNILNQVLKQSPAGKDASRGHCCELLPGNG
jgi:hypothetical protein